MLDAGRGPPSSRGSWCQESTHGDTRGHRDFTSGHTERRAPDVNDGDTRIEALERELDERVARVFVP
jgi:hypothetical protein